jgi:branched-chain amino acid transport system ATP-binding protein
MTNNLLIAENITVKFGGLTAVSDVSFTIPENSVVSLIGPNGAGKTTFFNVLTGLYKPTEGWVGLGDQDITGLPTHRISAMGLARTFQNIRLFGSMTAEENVMVAMHSHMKAGVASTVFGTRSQRREEREALDNARELLDFLGLSGFGNEYARNLPYGNQRRLEVARALALKPKVLLLDEPTAGMNPREKEDLADLIGGIKEKLGVSILLIEHHIDFVRRVSERITVLDRGAKIAEGSPDEVLSNEQVITAYLGKAHKAGGKA